jgi:hypothetical protein
LPHVAPLHEAGASHRRGLRQRPRQRARMHVPILDQPQPAWTAGPSCGSSARSSAVAAAPPTAAFDLPPPPRARASASSAVNASSSSPTAAADVDARQRVQLGGDGGYSGTLRRPSSSSGPGPSDSHCGPRMPAAALEASAPGMPRSMTVTRRPAGAGAGPRRSP